MKKGITMEKVIQSFRLLIYCAGFLALFVSLMACGPPQYYRISRDTIEKIDTELIFWPPDMIPHPMPPWDYPTDEEPEMS